MTDSYYVKVRGKAKGPMTLGQIVAQIRRKRIGRHHEVSIDEGHTWSRAGEFEELFSPEGTGRVVEAAAVKEEPSNSEAPSWHYAQGDERLGPVPEDNIRMMLATGVLRSSDLVWNSSLDNWTPVSAVPSFAAHASMKSNETTSQEQDTSTALRKGDGSTDASPQVLTSSLFTLLFGVVGLASGPLLASLILLMTTDSFFGGSRTSGQELFNIFLFMLGVLACPLGAAISAICTGHPSLRMIRTNQSRFTGGGYALTGLILGYCVAGGSALGFFVFAIVLASKAAA